MSHRARYFDDAGKQHTPFPVSFMDASRFKTGDRIEFISDRRFWRPHPEGEQRINGVPHREYSLKGQIGVVVSANNGYGDYPPKWVDDDVADDGGFWDNQRAGWLVVQFPNDCMGNFPDGSCKPRACRLEEEGNTWRKAD